MSTLKPIIIVGSNGQNTSSSQLARYDTNFRATYGTNNGNNSNVNPPSGYNIGNLGGFIPSRRQGFFAGGVDGNDNIYCRYNVENGNNRVNVFCRLQEQRSTPTITGWNLFGENSINKSRQH